MTKVDHRKNYLLLVDTETIGDGSKPIVYDVGWVVCDTKGEVYDRGSYLVRETFFLDNFEDLGFYSKSRKPIYNAFLRNDYIGVLTFEKILKKLDEITADYRIDTLVGYNGSFDVRAFKMTCEEYKVTNIFETFKLYDLWGWANQLITNRKDYINMCIEYGYITEKGNMHTNAETVYRYICNDNSFDESHTAYLDCVCELEILRFCLKSHKKFDKLKKGNWNCDGQKMFHETYQPQLEF